jgi:hypothetical protein
MNILEMIDGLKQIHEEYGNIDIFNSYTGEQLNADEISVESESMEEDDGVYRDTHYLFIGNPVYDETN